MNGTPIVRLNRYIPHFIWHIRPIQHGRYAECSIYYLSIILGIIDLFIHLTFKPIYL